MYYVYLIEFSDGCQYVGCTNNVIRRTQQHNEKGRNEKSKLGVYLHKNGIRLTKSDLNVVKTFANREEALRAEREIAIKKDKQGIELLNDNYSKNCTRKGKNIGNTCKEYVVVNYKTHSVVYISDLKQYCEKNGLNYRYVQRTASKRNATTQYCVKAFHKEDWDSISDEEKTMFIDGSYFTKRDLEIQQRGIQRNSKCYLVETPSGEVVKVTNLDRFAEKVGVNSGNLHNTFRSGRKAGGYKVIKRI